MRFALTLLLSVCLLQFYKPAFAGLLSKEEGAKIVEKDIETGKLAHRTNKTIDSIVRLLANRFRSNGRKDLSKMILMDWDGKYNGMLVRLVVNARMEGFGDHKPLTDFLTYWCFAAKAILGEQIYFALHIDDLDIINYAIPVVFKCIDNVDINEYALHAIPLIGVTTYWATWGICTGLTWGTGFLFICPPIGSAAEQISSFTFAPRLSDAMFPIFCGKNWEVLEEREDNSIDYFYSP